MQPCRPSEETERSFCMKIAKNEKERLRAAEQENLMLRAMLAKATADLEYVAMMADVDMDENVEENVNE